MSAASAHGPDCGCTRCRGFEPGNLVAGKSLATSEQALAPLRVELDGSLLADYPYLDDRRRALLADRLARILKARQWLDAQDSIVRDADGRMFDVCDRLEKWSNRAELLLAELEAERRQAERPESMVLAMQRQAREARES